MIAEVANALGDPEGPGFLAIEAGTGTGKTIAYTIAALPVAQARSKKLIIATATVALQEQLVFKDLPEIKRHSGINFSYQLAKGRGRYLCLYKLDQLSQGVTDQPILSMYPDELEIPENGEAERTYDAMLRAVSDDSWDGDLDAWPEVLDVGLARSITTDHGQCLGRRCPHITGCSFFRAREGLEEADIIVTNHDLVLSDFRLGGGRILPPPEDGFYIFDEGHQLAEKCINQFACFSRSGRTLNNLAEAQQWLDNKREFLLENDVRSETLSVLSANITDLLQVSRDTYALCWDALGQNMDGRSDLRFSFGRVPDELRDASVVLRDLWALHSQKLSPLLGLVEILVEEADADHRDTWESSLNDLQVIAARAEGQFALWDSYASSSDDATMPWARWIKHYGDESSIECYASPIYARDILVGFDQGGLLTEAIVKSPHCVLLLDEIEKAHPDIFNILLQVMDAGVLTDNNGRKADFRNVILIMTTNVGAELLAKRNIGFSSSTNESDAMNSLNKLFTPEFRNRLDETIQFNYLDKSIILSIVDKFLTKLQAQLDKRNVEIVVSKAVINWIADNGYDKEMGARPMERFISKNIKKPLVDKLLFGNLKSGGQIKLDIVNGSLKFSEIKDKVKA